MNTIKTHSETIQQLGTAYYGAQTPFIPRTFTKKLLVELYGNRRDLDWLFTFECPTCGDQRHYHYEHCHHANGSEWPPECLCRGYAVRIAMNLIAEHGVSVENAT